MKIHNREIYRVITADGSRSHAKFVEWINPELPRKMPPSLWFTQRYLSMTMISFGTFKLLMNYKGDWFQVIINNLQSPFPMTKLYLCLGYHRLWMGTWFQHGAIAIIRVGLPHLHIVMFSGDRIWDANLLGYCQEHICILGV